MPVMNGRETMRVLRKLYPEVKPIILSMHNDVWIISELIREGARSFLLKNCTTDELLDALFDVKFRGSYISEVVEQAMFVQSDHELKRADYSIRLSINSRDQLILKMICDGKTSDEIAERMCLSKKSIDAIRSELLRKLGAKNTADLVRKGVYYGLYRARSDEQILNEEEQEQRSREERRMERYNQSSKGDLF
jgi:DNA-binding NarL/FixJ family response regulator